MSSDSDLSSQQQMQAAGAVTRIAALRSLRRGRNHAWDKKLVDAVRSGSLYRTQQALEAGANPDSRITSTSRGKLHNGGYVLGWALAREEYGIANALVEAGANVNITVRNNVMPWVQKLASAGLPAGNRKDMAEALAIKMIEKGADVTYQQEAGSYPSFLHALAKNALRPQLAKVALLHNAPLHSLNDEGLTAEEVLKRPLPAAFQEANQRMGWLLRQHRVAVCPDIADAEQLASLTRQDVEKPRDSGACALDHWHLWDNYRAVQDGLKSRGEELLSARDLLQPIGGADERNPPTRLEVMLDLCPQLGAQLFDADLWKGETVENAARFCALLPPELREAAPYYSLRAKLQQEQQAESRKGR